MKEKRYLINLWRVLLIGVLAAFLPNTAKAWEGSGTSTEPYLIKTIADMTQLANDVNGGALKERLLFFLFLSRLCLFSSFLFYITYIHTINYKSKLVNFQLLNATENNFVLEQIF